MQLVFPYRRAPAGPERPGVQSPPSTGEETTGVTTSITGAAALVRAMDIYPNQIREVRTAPSFPYEPAYPAALLRELLPTETILVTPTPRIIGSGHWDVNDILAAGTGEGPAGA